MNALLKILPLCLLLAVSFPAQADSGARKSATLKGAAIGAVAGYVVGGNKRSAAAGAAVGGAIGYSRVKAAESKAGNSGGSGGKWASPTGGPRDYRLSIECEDEEFAEENEDECEAF